MLIRFAGFRLDCTRRQLEDTDGTSLHLTPKAFNLLRILIDEAPRVVSKHELHERLWPGTFVTDAALTSLVKELRRVLRDHDPAAPLLKTVHSIGYAFAAGTRAIDAPRASDHWLVGSRGRYSLKPGINVVGRAFDADVSLDESGVSRRHARIVVEGDGAFIEDLGSKNGTFVGGLRVCDRVPLCDGDAVGLGGLALTYRRQTSNAATATVAGGE